MKAEIKFHPLKMEIPIQKGEVAYAYGDLVVAEYENLFMKFYFVDGKTYKAEITLKRLLDNLPPQVFFQCNRNAIINICRYKSYGLFTSTIVMENGQELRLSARRIKAFRHQKKGLTRISTPCKEKSEYSSESCSGRSLFCRLKKPDD